MTAPATRTREHRLRGEAAREVAIEPVWKQVNPALRDELVKLWLDSGAMADRTRAAQRADEAVCVVRNEHGAVCGVSTAQVRVLPRLRQPMYYFRMFLAKNARGMEQVVPMHNRAKDVLQAYNQTLPAPESLGILIEFESRFLSARYKLAYDASADSTFIGYSPRGLQLRVSYFEGATLQAPAPLARAVAARGRA